MKQLQLFETDKFHIGIQTCKRIVEYCKKSNEKEEKIKYKTTKSIKQINKNYGKTNFI